MIFNSFFPVTIVLSVAIGLILLFTWFEWKRNFRFFFYSLDGTEPPHIHVEHGDDTAKFWLEPVSVAESRGFRSHQLNRIRMMVIENRATFLEAWHAHFSR